AFSPKGECIATICYGDDKLRLWGATSGRLHRELRGHPSGVASMAFSPDGTRLVSGGHDTTVKVWNVLTGARLNTLRGHTQGVTGVAFSPTGTHIASAGGSLKLWDPGLRQENRIIGYPNTNGCLAFSPDGKLLATSEATGFARIFDLASGENLRTLRG